MAPLKSVIEIAFSEVSLTAMQDLTEALGEYVPDSRLMAMLRDVWVQFGCERRDTDGLLVGLSSCGLSVLEDIEHELRAAGMIDDAGLERADL